MTTCRSRKRFDAVELSIEKQIHKSFWQLAGTGLEQANFQISLLRCFLNCRGFQCITSVAWIHKNVSITLLLIYSLSKHVSPRVCPQKSVTQPWIQWTSICVSVYLEWYFCPGVGKIIIKIRQNWMRINIEFHFNVNLTWHLIKPHTTQLLPLVLVESFLIYANDIKLNFVTIYLIEKP